jgi:hypothetical protein
MERAFLHDRQSAVSEKAAREGLTATEQLTFDQMQALPHESFRPVASARPQPS